MFKKITAVVLLTGICITGTYAYTTADVDTANYLASQGIIQDWSSLPASYHLDSTISRVGVMSMLLGITKTSLNGSCRGDFADAPADTSNNSWVCRTVETAADHGFIYNQPLTAVGERLTHPTDSITRSEALGIMMKAFPDTGAYAGYSYYWDGNFPNDGDNIGYNNAYEFGAEWQARTFYDYIRKVLQDDTMLRINPRVNVPAKLSEVFGFAQAIMQKRG